MEFNWSSLLTDDTLTLPNELWPDIPQTTAGRFPDMPKSSSNRTTGSQPGDSFDPLLLNTTGADPIFDDALFANDYFLGDLGVLQPFGSAIGGDETTTDSSPEPTSSISSTAPNYFQTETETEITSASVTPGSMSSLSKQSPSLPVMPKLVQRAQTYPNPSYESMFPNSLEAGFVEDVTFPDGPNGKPSTKTSQEETTTKRNKAQPDILSACWTSPLCPNHDQDGPPPNPSTCGGGCAPFLFANDDALPNSTLDSIAEDVIPEEGVVEIQSRSRKRADSDTSHDETGRQFATTPKTQPKKESPEDSSMSPPMPAGDDPKPKGRRRLPHNQVERKYRESLNTQLESLRRVVPSLQQNRNCDDADIEDLPVASKPSKAVVLASATAHIKQMEKDKKQLQDENQLLRNRVKALQALVKCEDCSLMQYVMDMKITQPQHINCPSARVA